MPGSFYVNAQIKGASVTDARSNQVPEQLILFENNSITKEVVGKSSLTDQPVMSDEDIEQLYDVLSRLQYSYLPKYYKSGYNALDVEFLVLEEETAEDAGARIVVLQTRPFEQRYS
jgi:hypothetical protein